MSDVMTKHVCCEHVPARTQDARSLEQSIEYFRRKLEEDELEQKRQRTEGWWW